MLIELTNKKDTETVNFIDNSKKNLRVIASIFPKTFEDADVMIMDIAFYVSLEMDSLTQSLPLTDGKKNILENGTIEYYLNRKYKIPKGCEKIVFSMKHQKDFKVECRILLD